MAPNNVRSLGGKRELQKSLDSPAALPTIEESNSLSSSSTGLVDARIILEVIPYPVALWSLDRRLCVLNHLTRELLGFSDDDFRQDSFLWTDRIHLQDRERFVSSWAKLQEGEKRVSCQYRFLPKNQATALRLREVSTVHSRPEGDALGIWSLYVEEPAFEDEFTGGYPLRNW